VNQIREKIRFEVKYGADLIKVLASAGSCPRRSRSAHRSTRRKS